MEPDRKVKKWVLRYSKDNSATDAEIAELSQEIGLTKVMSTLLYTRGYRDLKSIRAFFRQEATCLHDPYLMLDMKSAVDRINRAIESGERIAIYGDYDVDGVTSVSLLYLYLTSYGADVGYYIPDRMAEGYGLSRPAIDRLHERGVKLIVTVDTGITAIDETAYATELGIDMVVTDHHECRPELPNAVAVVNPHRAGDPYPFKELAGVGVIFKVICALEIERCKKDGIAEIEAVRRICRNYADLVAIGTIADVMPVIDENRLIIKLGLRMIENTDRYGLRALIDAASGGKNERQTKKRKINSGFIGFTIAPRMNAAGRVSRASIAVELLLAEEENSAEILAEELCRLNLERQTEENRIAEEAYQKIEETLDREHDRVIVIEDDSWHQGIIGIVSSRITERYGLPSILISFDGTTQGEPLGTDVGKGSGRSIKGINLVEALMHCESLLIRYGGHELAAGLSVRRCNIDDFRKRINAYAAEHLSEEDLCVSIDADCEVDVRDLTMTLAQEISSLEPFGIANPVPNLVLKNVRIARIIPMGGGRHLRLVLQKDGIDLSAVWFGTGPTQFPFELWETVDVLFQLSINEFQNVTSLQLIIQDMRHAADFEKEYEQQLVRYEEIRNGASFDATEDVIPSRDDIALVFSALRKEYRAGHTVFSMRRILAMLSDCGIHYIKLKFIIRIMQELQVCGVSEPSADRYLFEFGYRAEKTNIEKSSILRKLKSQLRKG